MKTAQALNKTNSVTVINRAETDLKRIFEALETVMYTQNRADELGSMARSIETVLRNWYQVESSLISEAARELKRQQLEAHAAKVRAERQAERGIKSKTQFDPNDL